MAVKEKGVRLKVMESLQDDVYKGVARMDLQLMRDMGLARGDIILVSGTRDTYAIVDRAYPADVGENILRIDNLIRRNVRIGVGETVTVKKATGIKAAKRITIAPVQKGISVQATK